MRNYKVITPMLLALLLAAILMSCASTKPDPVVLNRSQRVQATLSDLNAALEKFNTEKGYFPKGMATLRDGKYFAIMPDLEREWDFQYFTDGGRVMLLEAASKASMPDGAGYKVTYRVPDGVWEGYGITVFPK